MSRLAYVVVALGTAAFTAAGPIKIFNTGVDDAGNLLLGGSADSHYTCIELSGPAHVLSTGNLWGAWLLPTDAKRIAPVDAWAQNPLGPYTIQTTFDLTGLDPATADISGFWAADQYGSMYLNGKSVASVPDGNWSGHLTAFDLNSGFVSGVNTLSFSVMYPDGADGLVVSGIHGTANPVPEPATAVLCLGAWLAALAKRRGR